MGAISGDWQQALAGEFRKPYYASLYKTVMHEYQTVKVFPPAQAHKDKHSTAVRMTAIYLFISQLPHQLTWDLR